MEILLLEHAGRRFAVDASWVAEIVEAAPATPLPFAPAWVEGLAGIAGQVLVLIDFGRRLGLPPTTGQGTVLVVKVGSERLAARVDRILCKLDLPADTLMPHQSAADAGEATYVSGEFAWEEQVVLCIGETAFSLEELEAVGEPNGSGGLLGTVSIQETREEEQAADEVVCLFFRCAGETYGLRLSDVAEVVTGEALTPVPQAPAEVAGMLLLRGSPLLVLSLSALLGRPDDGQAASLAVVEREGIRLALGVGPVLGIERFPLTGIQALPHSEAGLEGFVVSRRHGMSGLIALSALLDPERMVAYGKFMARKAQEITMQNFNDSTGNGDAIARLLTFRAGNERCALPLDWVQRVAEAGDEAAVPGADGELAGVAQIHGEVIPVVDLSRALGRSAGGSAGDAGAYLVVGAEGGTWALKVDKVERVISLHERDIEPVRADAGEWIGAVGKLDGQLLSIVRLDPLRQAA